MKTLIYFHARVDDLGNSERNQGWCVVPKRVQILQSGWRLRLGCYFDVLEEVCHLLQHHLGSVSISNDFFYIFKWQQILGIGSQKVYRAIGEVARSNKNIAVQSLRDELT